VPLTNCPECGRRVSTAAEACPQCGHPMCPTAPASAGPKCYACPASATTRCQNCGALSCVRHLRSIDVSYGRGELRCESCYSSTRAWQAFLFWFIVIVFGGLAVLAVAIVYGKILG
jgi:hypothetical protein